MLVGLVHGLADEAEFGDRAMAWIKRASEVPPVVLSSGVRPVTRGDRLGQQIAETARAASGRTRR